MLIESGDRVPADLRRTSVRNLQIDESALTGESVPVHKHCDPLALETILADRRNLALPARWRPLVRAKVLFGPPATRPKPAELPG